MELNHIQKELLKEVSNIEKIPVGAFNLRVDGKLVSRNSSANIEIISKKFKPGIDIIIKSGAKGERLDIPVLLTKTGLKDLVYNDFYVQDNAEVLIVAGCGVHNEGNLVSQHNGIHSFHIGKNAKVKYIEKHYGQKTEKGKNYLNPTTIIEIEENGFLEMNTTQIKGVDKTYRKTTAILASNTTLIINEKILTDGKQDATTEFILNLNGENSKANVVSRSIAKDFSKQVFISTVNGNSLCMGKTECDAIIMDSATVSATPKVNANNVNAKLIHEASIGKIAKEQLLKLMTLGLTEKEAEDQIISGFLK